MYFLLWIQNIIYMRIIVFLLLGFLIRAGFDYLIANDHQSAHSSFVKSSDSSILQ